MTIEKLIAEAEELCRPCFLLSTEGKGEVVGYWRGERADQPNTVPPEATALQSITHIITIDACLTERIGITSCSPSIGFAEIETTRGETQYRIFETPLAFSDLQCDGFPLYAVEGKSFPPFEAVCLYGGKHVETWLKKLGLQRHEYERALSEPEVGDYLDIYMDRSPIYQGGADAVVGGWHQCWPEDDFYMPLEMRLAMLTLRDSEPWYELWQATGRGNWSIKARIT